MKLIKEEQSKMTNGINSQQNNKILEEKSETNNNFKIKEKVLDISQQNKATDAKISLEKSKNESIKKFENIQNLNTKTSSNSKLHNSIQEDEFLKNLKSLKLDENENDIKNIQNKIFGSESQEDYSRDNSQSRSKSKKSNKKGKK
jgi:hypothetical protein